MLNKFMLKDTSGNKSTTATAFIIGFVVVNIKLLASGLSVAGYAMSDFNGVDYAAAVGALGAIYVMRRSSSKDKGEENESE